MRQVGDKVVMAVSLRWKGKVYLEAGEEVEIVRAISEVQKPYAVSNGVESFWVNDYDIKDKHGYINGPSNDR